MVATRSSLTLIRSKSDVKFCSSVALATVQVPVGTHSCQTGWYRQRTFPSLQKVLLDSLGIECNSSKLFLKGGTQTFETIII